MPQEAVVATLSQLGAPTCGVFRAELANARGVTLNQLARLARQGVIERVLPSTYRLVAVPPSSRQQLRAALLWAGELASAAGRSAGEVYGFEGVSASRPEIVLPRRVRARTTYASVHHADLPSLMLRTVHGVRTTGPEATLVRLAHVLDGEGLEIACEDARRRRLTSTAALRAYLERFGRRGHPGVASMRQLVAEVDPHHPARSTLEVKTRRLLVAHGLTDYVREYPLAWDGRRYLYDFAFPSANTILETNGRRWHDDPSRYERDNEKWSVPGRLGFRIVFATWDKVVHDPLRLIHELRTTMSASPDRR